MSFWVGLWVVLRELVCIASWKTSLLIIAQPRSTRFQNVLKRLCTSLIRSAIIFCARTQGHRNQHGMGEGIMG